MKKVSVKDAVGHPLMHDIARIIIGEVKDTPFRRGHVITAEDIPKLLDLGKEHVFIMDESDAHKIHEEDVAWALYDLCKSNNIYSSDEVREGKVEAFSRIHGVLEIDIEQLHHINGIGDLNIVTKFSNTVVQEGDKLAGMRCVPLLLEEEELQLAQHVHKEIYKNRPILEVHPFTIKRVGIVTTGSEVATGRIQDAFTPIIKERTEPFGVSLVSHEIVTDETERIVEAIQKVKSEGAEIIFCTGGMSIDPDDLTPGAIMRCAKEVITYGLPVLPGSMVCIAYMSDGTPIVGLPGGVLFSKPTAFDVLLPKLLSNRKITKEFCVQLGHGGLQ